MRQDPFPDPGPDGEHPDRSPLPPAAEGDGPAAMRESAARRAARRGADLRHDTDRLSDLTERDQAPGFALTPSRSGSRR